MARINITRRELYYRVWSEPMRKLSKSFGLSDRGLAKACKRHDIPCPPRGYWEKLAAGKDVHSTALPNPEGDYDIDFWVEEKKSVLKEEERERLTKEFFKKNGTPPSIVVKDSLRGCHELVSLARGKLERAERDENSLLVVPADSPLACRVSKASLRRALIIMDALIKTLEELGHKVSSGPQISVFEVDVRFSITELLDVIEEEPEAGNLEGDYEFFYNRRRRRKVPSGRLALSIDSDGADLIKGCTKTWRDGKTSLLEDKLDTFLSGLVEFAIRKKERDVFDEQEKAKAREDEFRRKREKELRLQEETRIQELFKEVAKWKQNEELKHYIQARKEKYVIEHGAIEQGSDFYIWIEWATGQVELLNPLRNPTMSMINSAEDSEQKQSNIFFDKGL